MLVTRRYEKSSENSEDLRVWLSAGHAWDTGSHPQYPHFHIFFLPTYPKTSCCLKYLCHTQSSWLWQFFLNLGTGRNRARHLRLPIVSSVIDRISKHSQQLPPPKCFKKQVAVFPTIQFPLAWNLKVSANGSLCWPNGQTTWFLVRKLITQVLLWFFYSSPS